ncbi:MAG: DNA repair protein RecO [Burkholderiales bacterium]
MAWTAFVLHHHHWSESSLILDLFTRETGRLTAVAKGAKRPHSQLRSVLLPFQKIHVAMTRRSTRGDNDLFVLQTLRSAEWIGGAGILSGASLFSGFYLNELLMKILMHQEPHPGLFDAYQSALCTLAQAPEVRVPAVLRAFELCLLQDLGVLPNLSLCTDTQKPVEPHILYLLSADCGVVQLQDSCQDEEALPGAILIGLQSAFLTGDFNAIMQTCTLALSPLKMALRGVLHYHLGFDHLRTRQIMLDMQALERHTTS